jgi:hypothetical protein
MYTQNFNGLCTATTIISLHASFFRAKMEFKTSEAFTGITVSMHMLLDLKTTKMK